MAQATAIEWTDVTWNPVHGCSKVSPGCAHCYAEALSLRYRQTTKPWTPANAPENVTVKPHKLREPLSGAQAWQGLGAAAAAAGKTDGKLVFVNSTSDLFHENVPEGFMAKVFATIARAPWHTFQILTKRPDRMREKLNDPDWWRMVWREVGLLPGATELATPAWHLGEGVYQLNNVWLGVSIENRRFVHRADLLRETPAAVRFISAEPLLGPLLYDWWGNVPAPPYDRASRGTSADDACWYDGFDGPELDLGGIDWLIVGGESGPGHRPMRAEWVRDLRDACVATGRPRVVTQTTARRDDGAFGPPEVLRGTAFFFKQTGGARPGGEALLDGREWREFPAVQA